jgi:hypothetical protein
MTPSRRWLGTLLGLAVLALGAPGCSSRSAGPGPDAGTTIFPASFRQSGFQTVRACRAPGEHSGLSGFTVWANDAAAATYDQILARGAGSDGGGAHQMPDGAIVIKELYNDRACTIIDRWVAMKKVAGFDPAHGDWFWQDVAATRSVISEGQLPGCSDCHEGRPDATCIGFGAVNAMDYLCTAP